MKSKDARAWISLGIVLLGVSFYSFVSLVREKDAEPVLASAGHVVTLSGLPVRVTIPKIRVDATVETVGLTPTGDVDTPKDPARAAWFAAGPRPGEVGSAVVVGHFGWRDNTPAVFDDLHTLAKGDLLYVEDDKGATITFVVRELRRYAPASDSSYVFLSNDGKAHLNLITCEGVWDAASKSYSKRLVVFTDEVT
ncbi:MAG: class F sortase [Candidatus Paceibacterota bacterium]|jgi:LPXTG-site transpeptidase (sortase) family protein